MNYAPQIVARRWMISACLLALCGLIALSGDHGNLVRNTGWLVAGTLAISLPIGTLLACLLVRTDLPGRRLFALVLGLMLFVPLYLQAAGWLAGFGIQGWQTQIYAGQPWIEGWRGAVWIHALAAVPWVGLIVSAGLMFSEADLEEVALLDASPMRVLWSVTLPRSMPALGVATLWVTLLTAGEMTVTDLFQIRTYAEEIYTQISMGALIEELSIGWLPSLLLVTCLAVAGLSLCSQLAPVMRWPVWRPTLTFRLGIWRWPLAILVVLVLLIIVGVPLANLAFKTGVLRTATSAGVERWWSLEKTLRFVAASPWNYAREFRWSLVIGALAATSAVAIGVVLAWISRRGGRAAGFILIFIAALLSLPGPLLGLGLIWLLNRPELPWLANLYDYSILAPWAALTLRGLPLAVLVLWHALRSVPEETLEAATLDGAGWWTRLVLIALPQRRTALVVAWLVSFAVTLGDLAASILVVPPGVMTLSIQIFSKLHYGQEDDVAGICLALIGLFALIGGLIAWLVPGRRPELFTPTSTEAIRA